MKKTLSLLLCFIYLYSYALEIWHCQNHYLPAADKFNEATEDAILFFRLFFLRSILRRNMLTRLIINTHGCLD